ARDGRGQVVLLTGEAGIGKSRLVQVLKQRATRELVTELSCRCSPYHQGSALHPAIDFLQRTLSFAPGVDADTKLQKLEQALTQAGFSLSESMPLFTALLSLSADDRYPALPMTPLRQKQKTLDAIIDWLMQTAS